MQVDPNRQALLCHCQDMGIQCSDKEKHRVLSPSENWEYAVVRLLIL